MILLVLIHSRHAIFRRAFRCRRQRYDTCRHAVAAAICALRFTMPLLPLFCAILRAPMRFFCLRHVVALPLTDLLPRHYFAATASLLAAAIRDADYQICRPLADSHCRIVDALFLLDAVAATATPCRFSALRCAMAPAIRERYYARVYDDYVGSVDVARHGYFVIRLRRCELRYYVIVDAASALMIRVPQRDAADGASCGVIMSLR